MPPTTLSLQLSTRSLWFSTCQLSGTPPLTNVQTLYLKNHSSQNEHTLNLLTQLQRTCFPPIGRVPFPMLGRVLQSYGVYAGQCNQPSTRFESHQTKKSWQRWLLIALQTRMCYAGLSFSTTRRSRLLNDLSHDLVARLCVVLILSQLGRYHTRHPAGATLEALHARPPIASEIATWSVVYVHSIPD